MIIAFTRLLWVVFLAPTQVDGVLQCRIIISKPSIPIFSLWDVAIDVTSVNTPANLQPEATPRLSHAFVACPLLQRPIFRLLTLVAIVSTEAIALIAIHEVSASGIVLARRSSIPQITIIDIFCAVFSSIAYSTNTIVLGRICLVLLADGFVRSFFALVGLTDSRHRLILACFNCS
jgi:hypothetical protein